MERGKWWKYLKNKVAGSGGWRNRIRKRVSTLINLSFPPVFLRNLFHDVAKIYGENILVVRYGLASLASAVVDYSFFWAFYRIISRVMLAVFIARVISILFNYLVVRNYVFRSTRKLLHTLPPYLLLAGTNIFIAAPSIELIVLQFHFHPLIAKLSVDITLYVLNFLFQKFFLFHK